MCAFWEFSPDTHTLGFCYPVPTDCTTLREWVWVEILSSRQMLGSRWQPLSQESPGCCAGRPEGHQEEPEAAWLEGAAGSSTEAERLRPAALALIIWAVRAGDYESRAIRRVPRSYGEIASYLVDGRELGHDTSRKKESRTWQYITLQSEGAEFLHLQGYSVRVPREGVSTRIPASWTRPWELPCSWGLPGPLVHAFGVGLGEELQGAPASLPA